MNLSRLAVPALLLLLLAGCNFSTGGSLPTPIPPEYLPTAIALTIQAAQASSPGEAALAAAPPTSSGEAVSPTPAAAAQGTRLPIQSAGSIVPPTQTPTPGPTRPPTRTPTQTPLPDIPIAAIQILRPGNLSRVISPFRVATYLRPGAGGNVRIELFGEDGRLLVQQEKTYRVSDTGRVNLLLDLEFSIPGAAEMGRLVISTRDERGRLMALNSVDLVLMSSGEADIYPSDALIEAIVIEQPQVRNMIQGGTLLISGTARPNDSASLLVQLVDAQGNVVGSRLAELSTPLPNGYTRFAVEIPYEVSGLTTVRLTVSEEDGAISSVKHLTSLEVLVGP